MRQTAHNWISTLKLRINIWNPDWSHRLTMPVQFISFAIVVGIIEVLQWLSTSRFHWPTLIVASEIGVLTFLALNYQPLRELVGEAGPRRSTLHLFVLGAAWILLFFPASFYVLGGELGSSVPREAKISIVAVTPTLGGLILAAAPISNPRRVHHDDLEIS